MHEALLVFAAVGAALLWQRAVPLKPVRETLTIRLNRLWEWMVIGRPRWCRRLAAPLWWLRGIIGCGECLVPYVGFGLGLSEGWRIAVLVGLASYAVYVFLTLLDRES